MLYHGSHKCHIKSCEAKYTASAREEARLQVEWIETPTPDPYTPVPTDDETVVLTGKLLFPLNYSRGGGKKFTFQFYPAQGNTIQGGHVTCWLSADGLCKQVM